MLFARADLTRVYGVSRRARGGRCADRTVTAEIPSVVGPTLQRETADRLDQALRW